MGRISSAYYSANATSVKLIGAITMLAGFFMIDSAGVFSGATIVAAGAVFLFGAGDSIPNGISIKTTLLYFTYGFLLIFGLGLSASP